MHWMMWMMLAAGGGRKDAEWGSILVWCGVLMVLLFVGFFIAVAAKKWLERDEGGGGIAISFTLGDLRDMYENGQISEEEFEAARAKMIERVGVGGSEEGEEGEEFGEELVVGEGRSNAGDEGGVEERANGGMVFEDESERVEGDEGESGNGPEDDEESGKRYRF